jgi:hypothetical protein
MSVFLFGGLATILGILRFHSVVRLLRVTSTSEGVGEIIIVVALELNLGALAANLPAMRSIYVKRAHDRKALRSQTASNVSGRPSNTHEMRELQENPLRDSPVSDSQEEL